MEYYGLIGYPIERSLSPKLHNFLLRRLGVDGFYDLYPVPPAADLARALADLRARGLTGVNVTIPHKIAVVPHCHALAPDAAAAGAVNTLVFESDGRTVGHNTDVEGFGRPLVQRAGPIQSKRILFLGAGGAARAAAFFASLGGARILVAARTADSAEELVDHAHVRWGAEARVVPWDERGLAAEEADVIVNATPAGGRLAPNVSPLPDGTRLQARQAVFEMVYRPRETPLVRQARAAGATVIDGLEMLVAQGVAALEVWLGRPIGRALAAEALEHLAAEAGG